MTIWLDNHLSPALAAWIENQTGHRCEHIRDRGLNRSSDRAIFDAARTFGHVIMTKDSDFVDLANKFGPPPGIILLTMGNTSTRHLVQILIDRLPAALNLLANGEPLVEIGGS